MEDAQVKAILEALLFANEKPVIIEQVKNIMPDVESTRIREIIEGLKVEYEKDYRGIRVVEVAGGFQMVTAGELNNYLKKFFSQRQKERLSGPSLETLAIIAYKQPVTRLDVESIRGVNVDGVMGTLLERGLIRIVGKKETVGRPFVYGTTKQFLEYFGLKSIEELPRLEEFSSLTSGMESMEKKDEPKIS